MKILLESDSENEKKGHKQFKKSWNKDMELLENSSEESSSSR